MSLSVSRGMVADGAKKLRVAWGVARRDWDDAVAKRFEDEFLEPMAPKLRAAVMAMEQLAALSARADRETSPDAVDEG